MIQVLADYPGQAARGGDYISGAPKGDITEIGRPDGPVVRPERVVDTGIDILGEGRLCFGERTARHIAREFGMVDGWRVEAMIEQTLAVIDERDLLSRELADARQQIANLMDLERSSPSELYVAADGSVHASKQAAASAGRKALKKAPAEVSGVAPITREEVAGVRA